MGATVHKNQKLEIEITALSSECQGIGRVEGFTIFVPFALPGERVIVHIIKVTSSYAIGKLLDIIKISKDRKAPHCESYGQCGGCSLQHLKYEAGCNAKHQSVIDSLERIGGIKDVAKKSCGIISMENPWRYRNKGAFPFSYNNGAEKSGLFAQRSHNVIQIQDCPIQNEDCISALKAVRKWAEKSQVELYDEQSGRGVLRRLVVRRASSGELMAIIVTTGKLPNKEDLIGELKESLKNITSIVHNINEQKTNSIMGNKYETIWGKDKIEHSICGNKFLVGAQSFLQVNDLQTEKLYEKAIEFAEITSKELVVDAYCGIGSISLALAKKANNVVGIEIVQGAIDDARQNASINGIDNVQFICAPVEEKISDILKSQAIDCVMLDPPRRGCEAKLIDALIEAEIPKIVYISCNPATLARDCKVLCQNGYEIKKFIAVDMFSWTEHVEVIVSICRKDI